MISSLKEYTLFGEKIILIILEKNMVTIKQKYVKLTEVMASKFIAILFPLNENDDFKVILKDIQKEYKKAKHYCYAYRVGMKSKSSERRDLTLKKSVFAVISQENLFTASFSESSERVWAKEPSLFQRVLT